MNCEKLLLLEVYILKCVLIINIHFYFEYSVSLWKWGFPHGVVANVLNCHIIVSELELSDKYPWERY